jgi:hypothetical protein
MSSESLHKSFGNVDTSPNEGLEFFKETHGFHALEKRLSVDLDEAASHASVAPVQEPVASEHLEGLVFFDKHQQTKHEEMHKFGIDKHLGGAGFDLDQAATTPKNQHHPINK